MLSTLFVTAVIFIKYKPVYSVSLSGETLGYINEKSELNKELDEYMNKREGTVAIVDIAVMPKYNFELVSRDTKTKEDIILQEVEETAVITHRLYAVTVNGEEKAKVDTEIEAQDIISRLKTDLKDGVSFELGYTEVFTTEKTSTSEENAFNSLNEIKVAKTAEYDAEQEKLKQEAAKKAAAERARKARAARIAAQQNNVAAGVAVANVNGLSITNPLRVSPKITSRFGERGSRRYTHTGLDLATSLGTPIYPIADGTVTFAGKSGSYGNVIKISHGNGIESWYAHCNDIFVGVGNNVSTGTNIGTVGSTGNSTGPHLHLEIRVNGSAVNPQNYLY